MKKRLSLLLVSLGILSQAGARTVYEEQFSSSSSINNFTIFHKGSGTKDWTYSSSALKFWDSKVEVEAWAMTPGIDFEAGKIYQLSYDSRISGSSGTHDIYVPVG